MQRYLKRDAVLRADSISFGTVMNASFTMDSRRGATS